MSEDGYKEVNTIFTKPIYNIMFAIQHKPFFAVALANRGNPSARNSKLYYSYHKDQGHIT